MVGGGVRSWAVSVCVRARGIVRACVRACVRIVTMSEGCGESRRLVPGGAGGCRDGPGCGAVRLCSAGCKV